MVDLRGTTPGRPPDVTAVASAPAEVLRLGTVLVRPDPESYDVGPERIAELRDQLPEGVVEALYTIHAGGNTPLLQLDSIAAELPESADADDLIEALDADPARTWWRLLAARVGQDEACPLELAERLILEDGDALVEVRQLTEAGGVGDDVAAALASDPEELGRTVAAAVAGLRPLWVQLAGEAMAAIERDVAYRRAQLAAGIDIGEIVLEATNGYELADDPKVRRVVLLPSYWFRPWLVVSRIGDAEVISTPVAERFVALPSEAPPPGVLKLFKALSDEGRLRLLRRMSTGPISLTEATEELGVTKATAHHHLSILRQAGLLSMRGEGRSIRYAVRGDPSTAARDALAAYVRPSG